jgi:hypothetical protein
MCFGGGGGDGGAADRARQQEVDRQNRINSGMGAINGAFTPFNDEYYANKTKAYNDYYTPQLAQQYDDSQKALKLQLSANGLGGSSAGAFGLSRLAKDYANQQAGISDQAAGYANQTRSDVQGMKNQLVSQLNATSDSAAAANAANNQAFIQSYKPNTFSPLTNAFQNYAQLYSADRNNALYSNGAYAGMFNQVPGNSPSNAAKSYKTVQ